MIACLIVDDEPVARGILRNYCGHLPVLHIAAECGNAFEAKEVLQHIKIDLIFLDINMPVLSGVSFLSTIKNPPVVIFTTAYHEHAVTAFDLAVCDYLLKPFSLERFMIAVDKAKEKLPAHFSVNRHPIADSSFFIKAEGRRHQVIYQDCLYAEAQGNYTRIVTANASILTKMPFSGLIGLLPGELFIRTHRSFIVNKTLIRYIEGNRVFIGDKQIPIANAYRDGFLLALNL
jgi:DNA-binding LytR/AlgR family response regulator